MKRIVTQLSLFICLIFVTYQFFENPYTDNYLSSLKTESMTVSKMNDNLYNLIKERASQYNEKPIDAVIDPVWKAIPGYNGREVDVERSYEIMKKNGRFNKHELVFKEVAPNVSLDDLEASPIYKGNPKKAMVAFQINVAWGNEFLPDLLKILKQHNIHATFFLDGSWTKKNSSYVKMIVSEGHEIGNHAYSHPDLKKMTTAQIREELVKTNQIINATVNETPKWFAPPSGSYRDEVVKVAEELNMKTVLWTVDTVDWRAPNPTQMAYRVIQEVHPGAMILMHPTKSAVDGLEQMIIGIEKKGFKIGTVSELLSEKRLPVK